MDVTVPHKARRPNAPGQARLHYRDHAESDVVGGVTSPVRTVIECLRDLTLAEALSVGDSALASGTVTFDELEVAATTLRGPGSALVRRRLGLLDARAANAFESTCRAILIEAGLTGFKPQVTIRYRGQWVGRVDLADRRLRIVIECDGFATHGTRAAMVDDAVRHTKLVAAGWRPLRLTWAQVMYEREWVTQVVLDTVALALDEARALARRGRPRTEGTAQRLTEPLRQAV